MAGLIPLGSVIDPSKDVFPTTGPHLDVRVIPQFGPQKGKKIDPKTARSLLQNVLIGQDRKPLVQQQGQDWRWNFPITSGFGPRKAPTAGASTYHRGIDVSLGAGTPLIYKGYGTFRPDSGFGSLMTADAQGNPYEIRFLHTQPGKAASVGSQIAPSVPQLPSPEGQQAPAGIDSDTWARAYVQSQLQNQSQQGQLIGALIEVLGEKEKPKTLMEQVKEGLIGGMMRQALTPTNFLSKFTEQEPYLQGQRFATNQFFGM